MPLHLNLLAITYFFAGLGILYISGFWLAAILFRDEDSSDLLLWAPLLGLSVVVVVLSNLNYLGVPVKFSILVLLALSVAADLLVIRRFLWKRDAQTLNSPFIFWAIGISTALFLLPFILYGAFYQFND